MDFVILRSKSILIDTMSLTNYENMPIQRLISFNKLLEYYV